MGNFIILSGTPAVGTKHIWNAMKQLHPDVARNLERVVPYVSREPRLGEKEGRDFHFRNAKALYEMATEASRYLCFLVDRVKCALDMNEVKRIAGLEGKTGFLEIPPAFFSKVSRRLGQERVSFISVFVSPLSRDEIGKLIFYGGGLEHGSKQIETLTARKLIFRALLESRQHPGEIEKAASPNIAGQAQGAFNGLMAAADYQWVLPNHCGEGDPNWGFGSEDPVFGDAARTLASFAAIARGEVPPYAETWQGLFPKGTLALGVPVLDPHK